MKRNAPTLVAAVSLASCLAIGVAWALSHADVRFLSAGGRVYVVVVWRLSPVFGHEHVTVSLETNARPVGEGPRIIVRQLRQVGSNSYLESGYHPLSAPARWRTVGGAFWAGQSFADDAPAPGTTPRPVCQWRVLAVPHWWLLTAAALPLVPLAVRAVRERARGRRNHCPSCGYDLRGNVSGVCPECGTPIAPATAEAA